MDKFFQGQGPIMLIFLVAMFFLFIMPARRRQKKEKNFAESLKKGDRVITKSGMHAKILELSEKDNSCVLETMAGKIKFDRSAISMEASQKLQAPVTKK